MRIRGALTGDEKWATYRGADIFCIPSQHERETFGLVILEAFCFSLPVVAANRRSTPEIVPEGECGLLFTPGDAADLADRLDSLILDGTETGARLSGATAIPREIHDRGASTPAR